MAIAPAGCERVLRQREIVAMIKQSLTVTA
jgi:hypothetical protein